MKKLIYTLLFVLISVAANGQQAKYVFYFIGDGMGVNQVNGTEMYQAELQNGRIGVEPLLFTQFPVATMATTFSATNSITDSAAGFQYQNRLVQPFGENQAECHRQNDVALRIVYSLFLL